MKSLAAGLVALCLAACAAPGAIYWAKPGGTQEEFDRTSARCRMQRAMIPPTPRDTSAGAISIAGRDLQDAASSIAFMDDCLIVEGWTRSRFAHCVASDAKVGDRIKLKGGVGHVKTLAGTSSRCAQPELPILAEVE